MLVDTHNTKKSYDNFIVILRLYYLMIPITLGSLPEVTLQLSILIPVQHNVKKLHDTISWPCRFAATLEGSANDAAHVTTTTNRL